MPAPKRPPTGSRSGSYVPLALRGTVVVQIRCSADLAARARHEARRTGLSLADILSLGAHEAAQRPRALTDEEERDAARADALHDRLRDED